MQISTTIDRSAIIYTAHGDMDLAAIPALNAAIAALPAAPARVVWDLTDVPFLSIGPLQLLYRQKMLCQRAGRAVSVTGLQAGPLRLLQLADQLFYEGEWTESLPAPTTADAA